MREQQQNYRVSYAGKYIKQVYAHSKWHAIDKVYSENIDKYERSKLKAAISVWWSR
jgi:retron-type reverse transcriptase